MNQLKDILGALRAALLSLVDSLSPFAHELKSWVCAQYLGCWTKGAGSRTRPPGEGGQSAEFPLGLCVEGVVLNMTLFFSNIKSPGRLGFRVLFSARYACEEAADKGSIKACPGLPFCSLTKA